MTEKKIVTDALKKIESRMPEFEAKYHDAVSKALKFANAEISMLQKKIASLEKKDGAGATQVKREVKAAAIKVTKKPALKKALKKATAVKKAVAGSR